MDGWITIGTKLDTKDFDAQISELESELKDVEYELEHATKNKLTTREIDHYTAQAEKLRNKLIDLRKKQEDLNNTSFNEIQQNMSGIGTSTEDLIKKITKWSLAIFGIRSAYQFVRQSASTLSQYNEQMATDIEYIRFALASTLKPVIEWMIKAVFTLLAYVNYLAKAWFNIDLFANASAKNFNKMNKSAKELKNTMAGFDEMNVLSDTSKDTTKTPSVDLSATKIEDIPIPEWLVWIKDNWKLIVAALGAILGALLLFNLVSGKDKGLGAVGTSFTGFFNSLGKAAEAIAILGGLALVIESISDLITAFAESGLSLQEVGILLVEVLGLVALAFTGLAAATKLMDWTGIAAAVVILGGLALVLKTVENLIKTFSQSGMTLAEVGGLLAIVFGSIIVLMGSVALLGPAMTAGLVPFLAVIAGVSAILLVMAATLPTILDAVSKFIVAIAPVVIEYLKTMGALINSLINTLGKVLPPIINSVGNVFKTIFDGIAKVIQTVGNSLNNILSGVGSLVKSVLGSILGFIERLGPAINTFVDNAIQAVTKLINFMISGIEYLVNTLVIGGVNKIIDAINSIGKYVGMTIGRLDRFSIPRFRPQLAKGGIINMPGKGVPIGGAIGGEAGPEGVIPFTDQAQMEMIGEEIGKHVKIDLTNIIQLDGRELSRRVEQVSASRQFASGR